MNPRVFIGVIIMLMGLVLFIDNKTGIWPTVPLAGYIIMLIGGAIARLSKN